MTQGPNPNADPVSGPQNACSSQNAWYHVMGHV